MTFEFNLIPNIGCTGLAKLPARKTVSDVHDRFGAGGMDVLVDIIAFLIY